MAFVAAAPPRTLRALRHQRCPLRAPPHTAAPRRTHAVVARHDPSLLSDAAAQAWPLRPPHTAASPVDSDAASLDACHTEAQSALDGGDEGGGGGGDGDGGGGGGGGDSGKGDGKDDNGDGFEDVLRDFGKTQADLPADVSALRGDALRAYLTATRAGLGAWLARAWPGWRRRVAADPEFPFKILMEETVGLGLAASGMIAARGDRILQELDFAFCDIAVGGTLNFILVYLLTPVFGAAVGTSFVSRLPANLFAAGMYGPAARVAGFLYRGVLFAGCGFAGSVAGTSLSQGLLLARRKVKALRGDDTPEEPRELPNVIANSAAWAGFMFVSANPRYQALAGVERALFSGAMPEAAAKIASGLLRTGNNVVGGANWVQWARFIGLQKSE